MPARSAACTSPNMALCEMRVLMLLYSSEEEMFVGLIPHDQSGFLSSVQRVLANQQQVLQ